MVKNQIMKMTKVEIPESLIEEEDDILPIEEAPEIKITGSQTDYVDIHTL